MSERLRVIAALTAVLAGCGAPLRKPEVGPHTNEAPLLVPFLPPPVQSEIVAPATEARAVWIDGWWTWRGRRWEWLPGKWEAPRPAAYWAPATIVFLADGRIAFFPGHWHDVGGVAPK